MLDRRGLAGALVLAAVVIACSPAPSAPSPTPAVPTLSTPSIRPSLLPSAPARTVGPVETPTDTAVAGKPPCEPGDLKASHGLVEASGDTRLTEVVLVSAGACSVTTFPGVTLRDASGATVADSPPAGPGRTELVADVASTSQVRLSNWCTPEPAFPLTLALVVGDAVIDVTGSSFPEDGDLPPCATDGAPILEASAWNPTP